MPSKRGGSWPPCRRGARLGGSRSSDGKGDAQVGEGELDDRATQELDGGSSLVGLTANECGSALGVVNMQSRGLAEQVQDGLDRFHVVGVGMAEQGDVVRIQRDWRDGSCGMQSAQDSHVRSTLEESPKNVHGEDEQLR